MIPMKEPIWWENMLLFLNEYMKYNDFLLWLVPLTADVFVFLYPIYLVVLYVVWIVKKWDYYKESALWIFWSGVWSMLFNIFLQFFFDKVRPNVLLWLDYEKIETVLHKYLPESSFPSDHAAMSFGIAMWSILWGIRNKDKKFVWIWYIFLVFGLIMWLSRVIVWVHWPTDIIAWFIVGILIPIILFQKPIYKILKKVLIVPLIKIQKNIWNLFNIKK